MEYLEGCRLNGDDPLMYSQFCYYIQEDEQKRRATMHIPRKPGEQAEVDWADDPAHNHMLEYLGGVPRINVPDNAATAVDHKQSNLYTPTLNATYHEWAEHYNTAIIPARVRRPKDKPKAEGSVGNITTWITATLRNEQFFSLSELNQTIKL